MKHRKFSWTRYFRGVMKRASGFDWLFTITHGRITKVERARMIECAKKFGLYSDHPSAQNRTMTAFVRRIEP